MFSSLYPKIIVDPGSCHMKKLEYAKELIDLASNSGCWAIKFQLFKNSPPNIALPREWWPELVNYAEDRINIFASVFDKEALELVLKYNPPYIKYSFGMRFNRFIMPAKDSPTLIVSCLPSECECFSEDTLKLFCIPEYPVLYEVNFDGLFGHYPLDGFSDHTLGHRQTLKAIRAGAMIIEKHITLDYHDINCPDNLFALKPDELKEMMYVIKNG